MKDKRENTLGAAYRFYGFISYRHADKRWARRIQKGIEAYRLPSKLCEDCRLPRRVTPIFRDDDDLTGGKNVSELLEEYIRKSKYLIVICSRNLVKKPDYVEEEIRDFLACGNPVDNIIPVIIDGVACSADPALECLPPILLDMGEDRPLGITLAEGTGMGRCLKLLSIWFGWDRDCILKLVATMLGIEVSSLRTHDEKRRQRNRMVAMAAALASSLALAAFFGWQVLTVKQAQLREYNTYAQGLLGQGERQRAEALAQQAFTETNALMDPEIAGRAAELAMLSAIHPAFMPYARVAAYEMGDTPLMTPDGKSLVIWSERRIVRYDLSGNEVFRFALTEMNSRICAVSSDGRHAAIAALRQDESGTRTVLSLWDVEGQTCIGDLVASDGYDMNSIAANDWVSVVGATFSPDGSVVAAYRTGGYFNENEQLCLWDAQTGELLSSRESGVLGKNRLVTGCRFLGNRTVCWTGGQNYVFYDLDTDELDYVSISDADRKGLILGRYSPVIRTGAEGGRELGVSRTAADAHTDGASIEHASYGGHYAACWISAQGSDGQQYVETIGAADVFSDAFMPMQDVAKNRYGACSILGCEASPAAYAWLSGSQRSIPLRDKLVRMDAATGTMEEISMDGLTAPTGMRFIGTAAGYDYLCVNDQDDVKLLSVEIASGRTQVFRIDAGYTSFSGNAVLSASPDSPVLASVQQGAYYFYQTRMPGTLLDEGMQWDASQQLLAAVGEQGNTVVKAQGTLCAVIRGNEVTDEWAFQESAVSCGAAREGSMVFAATEREIRAAAEGGEMISCQVGEGRLLADAKLSPRGDVLYCLLRDEDAGFMSNYTVYTLEAIELSGELRAETISDRVIGLNSVEPRMLFDLSPDGDSLCVIEEGDSRRVLTLYDAHSGEVLARLDPKKSGQPNAPDAIHAVCYCDADTIANLFGSSFWLLDSHTLEIRENGYEAEAATQKPVMMRNGSLLYMGGSMEVFSPGLAGYETALPLEHRSSGLLKLRSKDSFCLSENEQWLTVTDENSTEIYKTADWSHADTLSGISVQVLYFGEDSLVCDDGVHIYRIAIGQNR